MEVQGIDRERGMQLREIEAHYSGEIASEIARIAQDKEIAVEYDKGKFGQRPMIINYPGDVSSLARAGVKAFHCSVETWRNPMELKTEVSKEFLDSLRTGWDYLIDIDSNAGLEFARKAALVFADELEHHYGISGFYTKFSGRRGFHMIVPFETFPMDIGGTPAEQTYPELPRKLTDHLKSLCREKLRKELIDSGHLTSDEGQDPYAYVDIDSAIFTSRHMFRMPYSLHLGTYLASIPLTSKELKHFRVEDAMPENVKIKKGFLSRERRSNARQFVEAAIHQYEEEKQEEMRPERKFTHALSLGSRAAPENFPPCMKEMLKGLSDGRKRASFLLAAYMLNVGWRKEEIELQLIDWNSRNKPPMRKLDLLAPLKGQLRLKRPLLPPNCSNQAHYKEIGVCVPDGFCSRIKNPLAYTILRMSKKRGARRTRRKNDNLRDTKKRSKAGAENK